MGIETVLLVFGLILFVAVYVVVKKAKGKKH
jgi:hypothetical protein